MVNSTVFTWYKMGPQGGKPLMRLMGRLMPGIGELFKKYQVN
jgi:hypothetical protein